MRADLQAWIPDSLHLTRRERLQRSFSSQLRLPLEDMGSDLSSINRHIFHISGKKIKQNLSTSKKSLFLSSPPHTQSNHLKMSLFFFFKEGLFVAQASLRLVTFFLLVLPEGWDYRHLLHSVLSGAGDQTQRLQRACQALYQVSPVYYCPCLFVCLFVFTVLRQIHSLAQAGWPHTQRPLSQFLGDYKCVPIMSC